MARLILYMVAVLCLSQTVFAGPKEEYRAAERRLEKLTVMERVQEALKREGLFNYYDFSSAQIEQGRCTLIPNDCDTVVYVSSKYSVCRVILATTAVSGTPKADSVDCLSPN